MKNNIIAVDPGETTGIVYWRRFLHPPKYESIVISVKSLSVTGPSSLVYSILENYYTSEFYESDDCLLIVEDYEIRPGSRINHSKEPLKILGMLEVIAWKFDHVDMIVQRPMNKSGTDEKLAFYGFKDYDFETEHEKDAARHIVRYLINKSYNEFDILNPLER